MLVRVPLSLYFLCISNFERVLTLAFRKKLAALSMLHKAKKAYYACDVLPSINRLAARTGCAVRAPCLLGVRQLS